MRITGHSEHHTGIIAMLVLMATTHISVVSGQTTLVSVPAVGSARRVAKNKEPKKQNITERKKVADNKAWIVCEEIYIPMCKGLVPYAYTKMPNRYNHTTQLDVYKHLAPLSAYMDHGCSRNTRLMLCASYLPKCIGKKPPQGPCKKTCMLAKKKCAGPLKELMGLEWTDKFDCKGLPSRHCVKPLKDAPCGYEHPNCLQNSVFPVCANLTFSWGTLPNMFGQCSITEINTEIQQLDALIATNCHLNLKFLLCGVYSPFCIRNEVPFTFPCKEICEEIRQACEPHYRRLYHGLPWPQKLQCHRYPSSEKQDIECVMPNEGSTFFGGK